MTIPWPTPTMTFKYWADSLHLLQPNIDINPIMADKHTKWQAIANKILQSQICQSLNCPRTDGYKTWQEWAISFIRSFGPNA